MVGQYNEVELARMQEEAINSARAMYRRTAPSRTNRRTENFAKKMTEESCKKEAAAYSCEKEQPKIQYNRGKLDDNFPSPQDIFGRKVEAKENDTMVIMSIIILLISEKSDFMLIFALLYILM